MAENEWQQDHEASGRIAYTGKKERTLNDSTQQGFSFLFTRSRTQALGMAPSNFSLSSTISINPIKTIPRHQQGSGGQLASYVIPSPTNVAANTKCNGHEEWLLKNHYQTSLR